MDVDNDDDDEIESFSESFFPYIREEGGNGNTGSNVIPSTLDTTFHLNF
jgi:hypothetical protein